MSKVTFLTGEYPPMQGGIADHTAYLAQHLAPLDVESSILISRRWQDATQEADVSPSQVYPTLPDWGWRCWPGVVNFLKIHQPDVLHIQYQAAAFDLGGWVNWLPWYLKKRGVATRVVTTFHDLRVPYIFPKAGPFRWQSMLALARHSDAVICTNREDLHTLQRAFNQPASSPLSSVPLTPYSVERKAFALPTPYSLLPTPCITLIPLGSNVEPHPPAGFDRTAWRKKYQATAETLLLAYFGFLNESKGGEELIEALALLRQQGLDAHLLLIGGDVGHADPTNVAYAQKVQALIDRHHLTDFVHRTGYVELPEVSANLLAADVVVMPYRDGVSFRRTTIIAALRHGCPVVSTLPANATLGEGLDEGLTEGLIEALSPEIQPGENMLLAPPSDAPALAQTIASLAENMTLRKKLSQGAKQLGNLFEWDKIAEQTKALYQAVVSPPQ